jgi:anti-sigma factor RsiW
MPRLAPCPTEHELQNFVLGSLGEAEAERLEQHLSSCARCLHVLQALPVAVDALSAALRSAALDPRPANPLVDQLKHRLRFLPLASLMAPGEQSTVATEASLHGQPADPAQTEELYPFLAPAEMPDEIGRLGVTGSGRCWGRAAWASSSRPRTCACGGAWPSR